MRQLRNLDWLQIMFKLCFKTHIFCSTWNFVNFDFRNPKLSNPAHKRMSVPPPQNLIFFQSLGAETYVSQIFRSAH
jgi:hypothetical protein